MENSEAIAHNDNTPFLEFHLSWVAYLREILGFLIRMLILSVVAMAVTYFLDGAILKKPGGATGHLS